MSETRWILTRYVDAWGEHRGLHVNVTVDTDAPQVLAAIERAAEQNLLNLERVEAEEK